jgi:hypothetical protein
MPLRRKAVQVCAQGGSLDEFCRQRGRPRFSCCAAQIGLPTPFSSELADEPRYQELVARLGLPLRIQGCEEWCRNLRARTAASARGDTADRSSTPVWDSNHAKSPQPILRSELQPRDSLFVAGNREGGVRKRPQPTSETPVANRTLIWLGGRDSNQQHAAGWAQTVLEWAAINGDWSCVSPNGD